MRLEEIITEQQLDERPMGMLGKLGARAQRLMPGRAGRRAIGKLEIGKVANEISDKFDVYMGKTDTGEGATPEMVLQFLKKNGYPTAGAEAVMKEPTFAQKAGEKLGKLATGAKNLAKDVVAGAQQANDPKTKTDTTKNTTPPNNDGTPKKIPTQTDQAQDDNISMSGVKANKSQPIKKVANSSFENNADSIMEGFTGGQLDKIFMAAAKDYVRQQEGGVDANKGAQGSVPDGQAQQGGTGGFIAGIKAGLKGDSKAIERPGIPKNINDQINKLNAEQKKELIGLLK